MEVASKGMSRQNREEPGKVDLQPPLQEGESPPPLAWQQMVSFLKVRNGRKKHLIKLTFEINLIKQKSTAFTSWSTQGAWVLPQATSKHPSPGGAAKHMRMQMNDDVEK